MKKVGMFEQGGFSEDAFTRLLVHDSPYFKIINFNFEPGQELPIHSHDIEGQVSILVMEGEGQFISDGPPIAAGAGDILVCDVAEPHGIQAYSHMRVLVTIAPPI